MARSMQMTSSIGNTASPLNASPLVEQPNYLIGLSVQMGIDLTPNQDLATRFDGLIEATKEMRRTLDDLQKRVRAYEHTVKGHTPVYLPDR